MEMMLERYKMMASLMEGDYEHVKNALFLKAVNAERNAELLAQVPHTRMGDIALTYWVKIGQGVDYVESAVIRSDRFPKLEWSSFTMTPWPTAPGCSRRC